MMMDNQILRWFWEKRISNDTVRTFCRRQLTARTDSSVLLPHAAVYIGHFADGLHDYEKLESAFFNDTDQLTRAAYLYALRFAPRDLKGRVYGRARGESTYLEGERAVLPSIDRQGDGGDAEISSLATGPRALGSTVTQNPRSTFESRGRFTERRRTASCCRRATLSRASSRRALKAEMRARTNDEIKQAWCRQTGD